MKKLILTTAEWMHLKWILERNMIRMDADAFRLKEGAPGSEARREAIGKELESISKKDFTNLTNRAAALLELFLHGFMQERKELEAEQG